MDLFDFLNLQFQRRIVRKFDKASNYGWAITRLKKVPGKTDLILEIGSMDALDAIFFKKYFSSRVIAVEPAPLNVMTCLENVRQAGFDSNDSVEILELCLIDKSGSVEFLNVVPEKYGNTGASSIFQIDFENRAQSDPDFGRESVQEKISVRAARFDALEIAIPHTIFMDVQGSELLALKGFGEKLGGVTNIVFETTFNSNYFGGCTFLEIDTFLRENGFTYASSDVFGKRRPRISKYFEKNREFNVFYSKSDN